MDRKRRGDLLTVGSVVLLNGGNRKVIIASRYALFDKKGVHGYFDYCGFFYPEEDWFQTEEDRNFIEALRNNQSNY